jgi:hypothetical protein
MKIKNLHEIKVNFIEFSSREENRPYRDKVYGTKYAGKTGFVHYILYAIIRGKNPDRCAHDINTYKYIDNMDLIKAIFSKDAVTDVDFKRYRYLFTPFIGGNIDYTDIFRLVNQNLRQ